MDNELLCKMRRIRKTGTETPLLVPSFSSIVDSKIGEILENLTDLIPDASLVSAYDIEKKYVYEKDLWSSNIVFIDSGMYEIEKITQSIRAELDTVVGSIRKISWTADDYIMLLNRLKPLSHAVIVNFDIRGKVRTQISAANSLFNNFNKYAKCFLCRPKSKKASYIDVNDLVENVDSLQPFDILGVTEKELGSSLIKRCENLLRIRRELVSRNLDLPIHIFGCLDPLGIIVFFLCGADIFDGTNWLKFSFHNKLTIYSNNYSILTGSWSDSDLSVRKSTYIFNLRELNHLMYEMRRYTQNYDSSVFGLSDDIMKQIKVITETASVRYR